MTSTNNRIAIIGAGISGLATAVCLSRLGFNRVHIYDGKPNDNTQSNTTPTGYISMLYYVYIQ